MLEKTEIDARFGSRLYTFYSFKDVSRARTIYIQKGIITLKDFESKLEHENIDFSYSLTETIS